ncbi:hypothetical protein LSAT2_031673 [Lamellibrachia satsuma]|nr:hypothetical protein LSAT2_031673 [Lamellibrachia satsuma]
MQLYVLCVVIGLARSGLGVVQDNFLLVTDSLSHGLFQIDLSAGSGLKIPLSQQTNPIAIAYDHMYSKIYWTDVQDKVIKRSNLDGTVEEVVKSLHKDSVPDGIAIDIAARLVYYTDTGADLIAVMTLDGSQHFTLVTEDMDQPRAIVLHPADGLMYWSDWGRSPKIEVAAMDGSQRRVLISLKSTSWANGLTIDPVGKRLYWCDGRLHTIESAAVDGSDRNILITTPGTHFFGIVFVEPNVYYTNWNRKYVSKINVSDPTPTPEQVGPDLFSRPNGIVAYNSGNNAYDVQMNSSCSYLNGGCKHVCLATPTGHRCACPDGLNFVNGTECSIPTYTCPEEYTARKGRIRSPGYPGYTNNLHCVIIIRMNNTQHEQRRIRLYVEDFDVPDKHDYLLIGDNKVTGSRLQRYNTYTGRLKSGCFVTDGSVVGRGFFFVYDIYSVVHCTSSSPCQNGGTCIEREYCMCPEGYEGNFCEQEYVTIYEDLPVAESVGADYEDTRLFRFKEGQSDAIESADGSEVVEEQIEQPRLITSDKDGLK